MHIFLRFPEMFDLLSMSGWSCLVLEVLHLFFDTMAIYSGFTPLKIVIFHIWLVVWKMNFMTFHMLVGNVIIPIDELIFFRGVGIPPTRYNMLRKSVRAGITRSEVCLLV